MFINSFSIPCQFQGLTTTHIDEVSLFGTVAGRWMSDDDLHPRESVTSSNRGSFGGDDVDDGNDGSDGDGSDNTCSDNSEGSDGGCSNSKGINITNFVEKPTRAEAKASLTMNGVGENHFLTIFGLYIVNDPEELWSIMSDQIRNNLRDKRTGSFSFTDTLNKLRMKSGLRGFILQGARLDIGTLPHVLHDDQQHQQQQEGKTRSPSLSTVTVDGAMVSMVREVSTEVSSVTADGATFSMVRQGSKSRS